MLPWLTHNGPPSTMLPLTVPEFRQGFVQDEARQDGTPVRNEATLEGDRIMLRTRKPRPIEVLTLVEAAAYLRLTEADVLRMVDEQGLSARQLGKEWRFLKSAIQDWL